MDKKDTTNDDVTTTRTAMTWNIASQALQSSFRRQIWTWSDVACVQGGTTSNVYHNLLMQWVYGRAQIVETLQAKSSLQRMVYKNWL